ncbi:MAG: ABC transporter ATP-binding protein [Dehalococcoidia bacterium]
MSYVQFDNVHTVLGGEEVHREVSFQVERGQVVCLLGPSGCGKTTALRIIAGLLDHYQGTVLVNGLPPAQGWKYNALVFQSPRLVYWRTALENVLLGLELRFGKRERRTFQERARHYLDAVGLSRDYHKFPGNMSGGEQHRVALARALVTEPELLLLDEPFSDLDITTRDRLWRLTLELCRSAQRTVLMVTHDLDEALYLADQIYVLSDKPARVLDSVSVEGSRFPSLELAEGLHPLRERLRASLGSPTSGQGSPSPAGHPVVEG